MRNARRKNGNILIRALIAALVFVMLFACAASAAEKVDSWSELSAAVADSASVEILLNGSFSADSTLNLNGGKEVIIDLNGRTITRASNAGTLFAVSGGAKLTIKDSANYTVRESSQNTRSSYDTPNGKAENGTGVALPSTYDNGTLTYYITRSTPKNDNTGTTEQRYRVTVSGGGKINGNGVASPIFDLSDGAVLNVENGMIFGSANRAIKMGQGGVEVNITGGYFFNNSSDGNGGAVYAESWWGDAQLNVSGKAVFAGNKAPSGGAIGLNGANVKMQLDNNAVITGNAATGSGRDGGGGVIVGYGAVLEMTGGMITNNWGVANYDDEWSDSANADVSDYDANGGGVHVHGTMYMSGGQITANEAAGGGGVSTRHWDGGTFVMTDGIVAGNVARQNEGGGITINMNGRGSITGGYVTNNTTATTVHWGGGGVFVANHGFLAMQTLLVMDNSADGFGGGMAGCSTGRIDTHNPGGIHTLDHSVAIFDNTAKGTQLSGTGSTKNEDHIYAAQDPVFMRDDGAHYQDYFCALSTSVCPGMLGSDSTNNPRAARWSGTTDGKALNQPDDSISDAELANGGKISSQYITGLTAHPKEEAKADAIKVAEVVISGNHSGTHGGGVLCDGYLIVGTHRTMEVGDRLVLQGTKTLLQDNVNGALTNGQFTFEIHEGSEKGEVIASGTNDANGLITFDSPLPFEKAGTYIFYINEKQTAQDGVILDEAIYRMTVTVTDTINEVQGVDPNGNNTLIRVTFHQITDIKIHVKGENGYAEPPIVHLENPDSQDNTPLVLDRGISFVNNVEEDTGFVVSKVVVDATGKSGNREFSFTVTLSDRTINGVYGDMTFTNGVAKFKLKGGESKTALDLPVGTQYTVVETPVDGYIVDDNEKKGTVSNNQVKSVVFTNAAVGSLTISKTVKAGAGVNPDQEFTFKITLSDKTINGPYGEKVNFTNGEATVVLKGGESLAIANLPAGTTYTVEELPVEGYTPEDGMFDGDIAVGVEDKVKFVNARDVGDLKIKKVIENGDKNKKFRFTVTLTNGTDISGRFGDVEFKNGIAEFELKHDQTVLIKGIPTGIAYTITEATDPFYAVGITGESSGTFTIEPKTVVYTNTGFEGLSVSKTMVGTQRDKAKEFTFHIKLTNPNTRISGKYGDLTFNNGEATFKLKDGERVIVTGLPADTSYRVWEEVDGKLYLVQVNGQDVGDVSGSLVGGSSVSLQFVNTRRAGNLELTKEVISPVPVDQNRSFGFTITLSEPLNGTYGDIAFKDGVAKVYLKHGQKLVAEGLPVGISYTIEEEPDPDFGENNDHIGEIPDGTAQERFVNARRVGNLAVKKVLQGATSDEAFGFKVVLAQKITGTFGDMSFVDGVAEFTLKAGEVKRAEGLPNGVAFTVIETHYDSERFEPLSTEYHGNVGDGTTVEVEFINKALRGLKVKKTVEGNAADKKKEFTFRVTLSDRSINGRYGDMNFVNGVATFKLCHGQTLSALDLPANITYVVEELDAEDYVVKSVHASGKIPQHGVAAAEFVNIREFAREEIPQTGDRSNLVLCIAALALSCSGLLLLAVRKRGA